MNDRVEVSKKLVLVNSASFIFTRLLSLAVLIWLQQHLLKRVTPEEYSLLPILYSVMMFAPLVSAVLTSGLGRYIVEAYAKQDDGRITQIVSTMLPILCAVGLVFLGMGWTFAWNIDKVLKIAPEQVLDARIMMGLLILSAAVRLPSSALTVGLFVRQKFVLQNLIEFGTVVSRAVILCVLLFGVSTRILWVIAATVSTEILNIIVLVYFSYRSLPALRFRLSCIRWPIVSEIIRFGGWEFCAQLSSTIVTNADALLLNAFGTAKDVTSFHIGSLPFRHIESLAGSAATSLGPATIALHSAGRVDVLGVLYQRTGKVALWSVMLFALPLMVYSNEVLALYAGKDYNDAARVMLLTLFYFPIAYGSFIAPGLARAVGRIRSWALLAVCLHICNLLLTVYMVAVLELGAFGAALGSLCAFIVGYPLLIWPFGLSLTGTTMRLWIARTVLPGLAPSVGALGILMLLKSTMGVQGWWTLGMQCASGWIVYAFSCYFLLDKRDLYDLDRCKFFFQNHPILKRRTAEERNICDQKDS